MLCPAGLVLVFLTHCIRSRYCGNKGLRHTACSSISKNQIESVLAFALFGVRSSDRGDAALYYRYLHCSSVQLERLGLSSVPQTYSGLCSPLV